MSKKFSREHLRKLAARGKGGLAAWAKKQLSRGTQKQEETMGRKKGGGGGGGGLMTLATGAAVYGFAARSIPAIANLSPLVRLAGAYFLAKQGGMVGNVAKAAFAVEAFSFTANAMNSGMLQISGGTNAGGYL